MIKRLVPIFLAATAFAQQATPHPKTIATIAREANGSVVSIVMSDKDGDPIAQGSGFVISKDGQVVTNYHVIKSGTSALIKLPNGAFFAVDGVLASDKDRDLAIIKAHGSDFRTLALGDSDGLQVGEEVVAIGNPLSLESTVSNGIVSGVRTIEEEGRKLLQITAPISPGSSGGPLFNMAGKVVGITSSHFKNGENLNFAIPINDLKPLLRVHNAKAYTFPDQQEPVTAQETAGKTEQEQQCTAIQAQFTSINTLYRSARNQYEWNAAHETSGIQRVCEQHWLDNICAEAAIGRGYFYSEVWPAAVDEFNRNQTELLDGFLQYGHRLNEISTQYSGAGCPATSDVHGGFAEESQQPRVGTTGQRAREAEDKQWYIDRFRSLSSEEQQRIKMFCKTHPSGWYGAPMPYSGMDCVAIHGEIN